MKTVLLAAVAVAALAGQASADFKVIGAFNGWDNGSSVLMADQGGGVYKGTITSGLSVNNINEFKVNVGDWSSSWPLSGNVKAVPTSSSLNVYFYSNTSPNDGWGPNGARVGYDDQGGTGFDLMGSPNGFSSPLASMTGWGNGIYTGNFVVAAPGSGGLKIRKAGDWGMSYGTNMGDPDGDIGFTTTVPGETVYVTLDLKGGRYSVVVPTPGAAALLGLAGLTGLRRRRA